MRSIFKYEVPLADYFSLEMPAGADILTIQVQNERPCLWAIVDKDAPMKTRRFATYGTGWELPPEEFLGKYAGTVQRNFGLVWHIFDLGEDK
jgi:hypothetical protein